MTMISYYANHLNGIPYDTTYLYKYNNIIIVKYNCTMPGEKKVVVYYKQ